MATDLMEPAKKPWTLNAHAFKASGHNDVMAILISRAMILGQLLTSWHAGNRMLTIVAVGALITIVTVGAQSTVYIFNLY